MTQKTKKIDDMTLDELDTELKRLTKKLDRIFEKQRLETDSKKRELLSINAKHLSNRRTDVIRAQRLKKEKIKQQVGLKNPPRNQFNAKPRPPVLEKRARDQEDDDPNPAMTLAKKLQESAAPSWMRPNDAPREDNLSDVEAETSGYTYKRIDSP